MDFKSLLNKLDGMEAPVATPKAPELPKSVQLNEDAQLRVLAGTSSILAEAKKMEADKKKAKAEKMEEGSKPDFLDMDKDGNKKEPMKKALKDKKKVKKESVDPAFKDKFAKMVEAKKAKPDFADLDKDGDKKEPMKKAAKEKKVKEGFDKDSKSGDSFKTKTGTATKTSTGVKHTRDKYEYDPGSDTDDDKKARAKKKAVKESIEPKLTFKQMIKLVQESGGQQQIDAVDRELFAWAQRIAAKKFNESAKQEVYAGLVYERMGGVFEMYDVLSEDQK